MTVQISAESLSPLHHNQLPVITTELLASLYGTEVNGIQQNFKRNIARFVVGKHFFKLEGNELRDFKNRLTDSQSVAKHTRSLILWTERGAARHAKMLETEQAWEVFEKLEDLNRPGFPGECFICELRLPDHCFRWKHNKLFLLLPEEYGPAFPAIVDCYTSPPTLVW
ncbi:hypothetical protein ECO2947_11460 [Escherichia coli]|nr:hypothetical protein ECO1752_11350 [Escherichia coli]CAK5461988.1 hypothetical protein ECO2947_11460 [Escherichia coli]